MQDSSFPRNILTYDQLIPYLKSGVEHISVSKDGAMPMTYQSCDFYKGIIQTKDAIIAVHHQPAGNEEGTFVFAHISAFTQKAYPWIVRSTPEEPIVFLNRILPDEGLMEGIRFRYGMRYLFIFASEKNLILTKSIIDLETLIPVSEMPHVDDSVLFNDIYQSKDGMQ